MSCFGIPCAVRCFQGKHMLVRGGGGSDKSIAVISAHIGMRAKVQAKYGNGMRAPTLHRSHARVLSLLILSEEWVVVEPRVCGVGCAGGAAQANERFFGRVGQSVRFRVAVLCTCDSSHSADNSVWGCDAAVVDGCGHAVPTGKGEYRVAGPC